MRPFRYRLAAVLTRAEYAERALQVELASLERYLAEARRHLELLSGRRAEMQARIRALLIQDEDQGTDHPIEPERLQAFQDDLETADVLLNRAFALHQIFELRVGAARVRLLEAARSRQLLENHRENLAEHHRRMELAAETKHLDELSATGFTHGRNRSQTTEQLIGDENTSPPEADLKRKDPNP